MSVKVLVTGSKGFIGKNLMAVLRLGDVDVAETDIDSAPEELLAGATDVDVVYHLAGVNRPSNEAEFTAGNVGSLSALFAAIDKAVAVTLTSAYPAIVLSSSTQVGQDNPYGRSKLAAEKALEGYAQRTGAPVAIYRLPGVFGKWCRPNYNSVVATFCYNVARDLPIAISEPCRRIELVYIDEVVETFLNILLALPQGLEFREVRPVFNLTLEELAGKIRYFKKSRETLLAPDFADPFTKRLYATYLSYLEPEAFAYDLQVRSDTRGELAEFLKQASFGQLFVSRTRPGITRGNHYHHTKVEKFLVVEGQAVIRFRHIISGEYRECAVTGKEYRVVDIPPGWTHSIQNVGGSDLVVLFWANEKFDPEAPDTYHAEVLDG